MLFLATAAVTLCLGGCSEEAKLYDGPPIELPELPAYRYPIRIASETESLVDQDGRPFFLQGDAGWSLISGTRREDAEVYLDDRAQRGFNSILVVLIDHTDPLTNAYGEAPFHVDGDFRTPNEEYFSYADFVIESAMERGIQVWLSPIYLGYKGGDEGFYADVIASDAEEMRDWGRWVGQRYGDLDALVWLMGGDFNPPAEGLALLDEVVAGIAEVDTRHLFTAHWAGETSGREIATSWLELNNTYTYKPVYLKALQVFQSGERPFVLLESIYENTNDALTQQIRAQAYYALLSGAKGHFYGNNPVWRFADDWKAELNSRGAAGMMHLRTLFADTAWTTLEPDLGPEIIVSGGGDWGQRNYALIAQDSHGMRAMAYVPSSRELVLDLSSMAGPSRAEWFDPTNGSYHLVEGSPLPNQADVVLASTPSNGDGDADWLLLLQVED